MCLRLLYVHKGVGTLSQNNSLQNYCHWQCKTLEIANGHLVEMSSPHNWQIGKMSRVLMLAFSLMATSAVARDASDGVPQVDASGLSAAVEAGGAVFGRFYMTG
jgi:hypothetical protein